jgi:hypothetical protein
MAEHTEYEDFDQLVNCRGWQRLSEIVQQTYGRASDRLFDAVTNAVKTDNIHAQDHLRQIIAEQRGALDVLNIPVNKMKQLKPETQAREFVGSRRGSL